MTEQEEEILVKIHKVTGEPEFNSEGSWQVDCYSEINGEYSEDIVYFSDKETMDAFLTYFKKPTLEPLVIRIG